MTRPNNTVAITNIQTMTRPNGTVAITNIHNIHTIQDPTTQLQ